MKKGQNNVGKPFHTRWWFWSIIILLVIGLSGKDNDTTQADNTSTSEETTVPIETTYTPEQISTNPPEGNEYAAVDSIIELYNASSTNPITDLTKMDIRGNDYKTEFRLNAFESAVGQKGNINGGAIEVINYGIWNNDSIRIYARVESHDVATDLLNCLIRVLDASLSDDEIEEAMQREHSIFLDGQYQITGYISTDYSDGGIVGYDVMIDCNSIDFLK